MSAIRAWRSGDQGAYVAGYGSRELVIAAGCPHPVWSNVERAWVILPKRLADVMALAEFEGRRVEWLGVRDVAS